MAAFRYESSQDPRLVATIGDLMLRGPQAQAAAAERIGQIQAQGAQQQAGAWSGAIQNIGQLIGNIPAQMQQQKRAELQDQIGTQQLQDMRANAADRVTQRAEQETGRHQALTSQIGLALHDRLRPDDPTGNLAAMQDALNAAEQHQLITSEQAQQYGAMASADPSKIPDVAKAWAGLTPQGRAEIEKTHTSKPGEVTTNLWDGGTVGPQVPEKDTEVELAKRAAAGDPLAIAAMNRLKPAPNRTAEQDDARYRDIVAKKELKQPISADDAAWATGYEHQKTLGVDATAGAANDRLSRTIAQQTAQQARAQTFQEAQAGKKELTDKIEKPWLDAQAQADNLRDVVKAAQSGNKVAATMQNLEATMTTIKAAGLTRMTNVELGNTEKAGSLWDSIVGRTEKLTSGQPVPPDLQRDMLKFADLLEQAAYKKYLRGHQSVTQRYGLSDEKPISGPVPSTVKMRAPNGQETDVPADQVEHYKTLGAKVVEK